MIENDAVSFVRVKGALVYIGNGSDLASYEPLHDDQTTPTDQFADDEATLEWALNGLSTKPRRTDLRRMILDNTKTYPMNKIARFCEGRSLMCFFHLMNLVFLKR